MKTIDVCTKNNIYQHIEVLKSNRNKRFRSNEFFVEGVRNINSAIKNGWSIRSLIYGQSPLSDWAEDVLKNTDTEVNYRLSPDLMREISGKTDTSELMAVVSMRDDSNMLRQYEFNDSSFVVVFDRPSNKGNLGTMIRSCDALGADLLILTGHGVDLYDPDVITSTMGSFFNLRVARVAENQTLADFIQRGRATVPSFELVGTTAHSDIPLYDVELSKALMLMIGNETKGLNYGFKELCDVLCKIPMNENGAASSFNVSCAASIAMYEVVRQRNRK